MSTRKNPFSNAFKDGILLISPIGVTLGLIYWGWTLIRKYIPDLSIILPKELTQHPSFTHFLDFFYLLLILIFITVFGMLASTFLGKFFNFIIDKILMSPTFIRPIYETFKKLAETIFQKDNNAPVSSDVSESVIIPYPNRETKSIGFITSTHARHLLGEEEGDKWITVYVPSAPVISAGFYLLCRKSDTEPCKLPSGQSMATIISMGAVQTISTDTVLPVEEKEEKHNYIRSWFFNGLLFLIPIGATMYLLSLAFNYLYIFISNISVLFPHLPLDPPYDNIALHLIIFVALILIIMIIGWIGESAFGLWVKSITLKIFNGIPMFNSVYGVVEQITKMFSPDPSSNNAFDKAVLVPFPTDATYAVGFVTGENADYIKAENGHDFCPVFVPTSPIPTTGWFIMAETSKTIHLDMPLEKAFGLVISAGITSEDKE